ncbi:hypothetical protein CDAR_197361 [Caerostris darwini]|uniref:Uncharacterized protein n=1 Tax=Caerostris darwini TaxID=1538125 RepID=A0AAV4R1S6_9ARAC|nr:hypothetical protein CDAR_197361 [Caerostris darwini]
MCLEYKVYISVINDVHYNGKMVHIPVANDLRTKYPEFEVHSSVENDLRSMCPEFEVHNSVENDFRSKCPEFKEQIPMVDNTHSSSK